jgi:MYXO-CTERM domain-containing protein
VQSPGVDRTIGVMARGARIFGTLLIALGSACGGDVQHSRIELALDAIADLDAIVLEPDAPLPDAPPDAASPADAPGVDAPPDAPSPGDAGFDAGVDADPPGDAGFDAGVDAGPPGDAGIDAPGDAQSPGDAQPPADAQPPGDAMPPDAELGDAAPPPDARGTPPGFDEGSIDRTSFYACGVAGTDALASVPLLVVIAIAIRRRRRVSERS